MKDKINIEYLLESIVYDSKTGIFKWLKRPLSHFADKRAMKITNTLRAGTVAGTRDGAHVEINIKGKRYRAHVLAWYMTYGNWPEMGIDHINNNPADNRIENLRLATPRQNGQNSKRRRDNTTGFKGVKQRGNKWTARIMVNGHRKWLGTYDSAEEAHKSYDEASILYFGEYARSA
jgi:hypothetical protein